MSHETKRRMRGPRPSGLIVLSIVLLVVGFGGTAVAGGKIGTRALYDGAVTSLKIKNETILSRDIKDGTIQARDLARSAKTPGPKGDKGDKGDAGAGRWVLVDATGAIVAQSGGFSISSAYDNAPGTPAGAVGNVYIDANENLSNNGIVATIALQNVTEQDANGNVNGRAPGADSNAEFSGEITATMCQIAGFVNCAPPAAQSRENFVVSPRLSNGGFTEAGNRKRFYVAITGDSSDLNAQGRGIPAVALP